MICPFALPILGEKGTSMKQAKTSPAIRLQVLPTPDEASPFEKPSLAVFVERLGINTTSPDTLAATLPFTPADTTAGVENELQAAVIGKGNDVDLPLAIRASHFYANIRRSIETGESPAQRISELDHFIDENRDGIWENSWVRIPLHRLRPFAAKTFEKDLRSDKRHPLSPRRSDADTFRMSLQGEEHLRIPVSYLLKLALADAIGATGTAPICRLTGKRLMAHFLSDNTSPETFSFFPVPFDARRKNGKGVAAETAKRYLLSQLLVMYANRRFGLLASGQKALIYFAPHPPARQKKLNGLISDAFYRDLFMNPCLSGWNRGEKKHRYMALCHRMLSRSHLNAVGKLREAGILTNNLMVLPSMSNISLANNGTHISLGSKRISAMMQASGSPDALRDEKYFGDLAIKCCEHFLPLFVGTYSAAPYRLDFADFHPETVLGFLPHELTYKHLRMIWRRWKKKARISVFGRPLTPFGPGWLDRLVSSTFGLRGDFVNDFRLIDYLVCLLSTTRSPALDGSGLNHERLKKDLEELGIFNSEMPMYLLYRLRDYATMGFSGFEGRHYSLFASLVMDMGPAADLQALITALAFKWIVTGKVRHDDIPDTPQAESERRQAFFGAAIGIPTFYVLAKTRNRLLARLVAATPRTRPSRRYPGYTRVCANAFRQTLVDTLKREAPELIESMGLVQTLQDLQQRLAEPENHSVAGRLNRGILEQAGVRSAMHLSRDEFLNQAETYYRTSLRDHHLREALAIFEEDLSRLDSWKSWRGGIYNQPLLKILGGRSAWEHLAYIREDLLQENLSTREIEKLLQLLLLSIHHDLCEHGESFDARLFNDLD
jgi:hypothetical protein